MSKITEPRELLEHKLATMLYVERELAENVLPELIEEIDNPLLMQSLTGHLDRKSVV